MITTRFYLDARHLTDDTPATLKLMLTHRGRVAMMPTGVKLLRSQWDKDAQKVIKCDNKTTLNTYLIKFKLRVDDRIRELTLAGELANEDLTTIKNRIQEEFEGRKCATNFVEYFEQIANSRKSEGTRAVYMNALRVCRQYDIHLDGRVLTEITARWCDEFREYIASERRALSQNSQNILVSTLRSVLNCAMRDELIRVNPLQGAKTPYVQTRKRNLTREQLRKLWNATPRTKYERAGLDFFKFSFLLIAANAADVAKMTPDSIFNGRIEYVRAKTKKHYSIAIVDELWPILKVWQSEHSLFSFFEGHSERSYAIPSLNAGLRTLCKREGLPPVSTYWARHTWASLAMELSAPIEVISAALGHSYGARVTMGYVNLEQKRVDDLNRQVINFALYDKIRK